MLTVMWWGLTNSGDVYNNSIMRIKQKTVMDLIDKLKAHEGIKSLRLNWYLVPSEEEDDVLMFIAKKTVAEYPEYEYIAGSLPYSGIVKDMDAEVECLFLSLEDMINAG